MLISIILINKLFKKQIIFFQIIHIFIINFNYLKYNFIFFFTITIQNFIKFIKKKIKITIKLLFISFFLINNLYLIYTNKTIH